MKFKCNTCGKIHQGMPSFGWPYPVQYLSIPEDERSERASLGTDDCVIEEQYFFVRGSLEIHVHNQKEPFSWGVWASLSQDSFAQFVQYFHEMERSHIGPFFGWLSSDIWVYPDTINLKAIIHLRNSGRRPYVELEPTGHPLAIEQREGITVERVAEIYSLMTHGKSA